jgi:hypothetical protein
VRPGGQLEPDNKPHLTDGNGRRVSQWTGVLFAGGIMQHGYQCGMLWSATLDGVGDHADHVCKGGCSKIIDAMAAQ